MKEALQYRKLEAGVVECFLCSHRCVIKPGKRGVCAVRENQGGTLVSLVYDKVISVACDPIEKKPLYHFLPGSLSLSIATVGCNFRCLHCQNASISQYTRDSDGAVDGRAIAPERIVDEAERAGCRSISYTYTEPTIFMELALDCGTLARERGLKNVFVTNGYMTPETVELCRSFLDAANVDLKGFDDRKYKRICGARLAPVLETIRGLHESGIWVEVTTLLIPGHNDDPDELRQIAGFIAGVSPSVPWHVSAFHPTYKMIDRPPTSAAAIEQACTIGKEAGLHHVYSGNVFSAERSKTFCHHCRATLIERSGFRIETDRIANGRCPRCGAAVDGVFEKGPEPRGTDDD